MKHWQKTMGFVTLCSLALVGCSHSSNQANPATNTTLDSGHQANQATSDTQQESQTSQQNEKTELVVSAAVSLKDSLDQIQTAFEKEHPDIQLTYNFGASGTLEQQIDQGSPTDVFISAGEKQMQDLLDKQEIDKNAEGDLLRNQLVLITPKNGAAISSIDVLNRPDIKKIAIGVPNSVPAGLYAKQTLSYYKDWDALQSKLVYAKDVQQVLSDVETGNVDAGFVYKTDALTSSHVQVAVNVEDRSHEPILYPAGVVKMSKHYDQAKMFYEYLQSSEAIKIFEQQGFSTLK